MYDIRCILHVKVKKIQYKISFKVQKVKILFLKIKRRENTNFILVLVCCAYIHRYACVHVCTCTTLLLYNCKKYRK